MIYSYAEFTKTIWRLDSDAPLQQNETLVVEMKMESWLDMREAGIGRRWVSQRCLQGRMTD